MKIFFKSSIGKHNAPNKFEINSKGNSGKGFCLLSPQQQFLQHVAKQLATHTDPKKGELPTLQTPLKDGCTTSKTNIDITSCTRKTYTYSYSMSDCRHLSSFVLLNALQLPFLHAPLCTYKHTCSHTFTYQQTSCFSEN